MKKSIFGQCFIVLCLFSASVWWASGSIRGASAMSKGHGAPAGDSADVAAIKQLGQDMGDAMVAGDTDKLSNIYGDDWASVKIFGQGNHEGDDAN